MNCCYCDVRKFLCSCRLPRSPYLQDNGMIQIFSVPSSDRLPSSSSLPVFLPSQAMVLHPMVAGGTRKESQPSVSVIDLHRNTHKTVHLEQKWGMWIAVYHDMYSCTCTCSMFRSMQYVLHVCIGSDFVWESILVGWWLNGNFPSHNLPKLNVSYYYE